MTSVETSVRHRQVQPPITIEVAHGHGSTIVVSIEVPCRLEGAINVAQQHRNSAAVTSVETSVGHRQIGPPITIEVADDHGGRAKACREALGWLEGAIAVAQQHRDVVGSSVGHRQVEPPIAIDVAHGHG